MPTQNRFYLSLSALIRGNRWPVFAVIAFVCGFAGALG